MKTMLLSFMTIVSVAVQAAGGKVYSIENRFLSRTFSVKNGCLATTAIKNKISGYAVSVPAASDCFSLRISQGTDKPGTDRILTGKDFRFLKESESTSDGVKTLSFYLENKKEGIEVTVCYELDNDQPYLRKYLKIKTSRKICIERVNIDSLALSDVYQPYTIRQLAGKGGSQWRTGLGQPLYSRKSALFLGTEFPAAYNFVKNGVYNCGYLYGHVMKPGDTLVTYKAVMGAGDSPEFISDTFYEYIDKIRIRPLRLQTQYNSWFDYFKSVDKEKFIKSVEMVNEELCVKRGVPPLKAYVIDDGWQNSKADADWSDKVWPVNKKFDSQFKYAFEAVHKAHSGLGLWMSPGCNFGAAPIVPSLRKKGWGALGNYMSLAYTPYMDRLEVRMVELAKMGVSFFKLDGLFGHLCRREFDLDGADHGVPVVPAPGLDKSNFDDNKINDSKYDEAKIYYLTVATERLMKIFAKLAETNPKVYIVISNGAWLSPWWLMHIDTVWMINAGDAAGGKSRTDQLVYRDNIYYQIWKTEKTQFPMCSLFNHEPKKNKTGESEDQFRRYMYMSLSRGSGFEELYLKTFVLKDKDWDVIAEALKWSAKVFPVFKRVRMHGGNPDSKEVYGYTAWNSGMGYVSIHNPSDKPQSYSFILDRKFGLLPGKRKYRLSSPLKDGAAGLNPEYSYGEKVSLELKPAEIRILDFTAVP